ncbi:MAG: hypothetical protein M8357_12665 [Desulfobulbaceae bacterium]|nr:hypothetical protein [Desulfobulbaceae bacterium]
MNLFISNQQTLYQLDAKEVNNERTTIGDMFAVGLVSFYTFTALIVSSWSAILLITGKSANGGPIGYMVDLLQSSGII